MRASRCRTMEDTACRGRRPQPSRPAGITYASPPRPSLLNAAVKKQPPALFADWHTWEQINPAVRLAVDSLSSPRAKLRVLTDTVLGFLEKDRAVRTLFLLEGRRIRGDGYMVVLVPGSWNSSKQSMESLKNCSRKAS